MAPGDGIFLFSSPHTGSTTMTITPSRHLASTVAESEWFHIFAQIISSGLLFVLIFGMSATVDTGHLREQVHNKFAILTGVATQFIIMPLLGFASVMLLSGHGLTEPMAISLLIVTASPGGSYSNWWCSMFNADLALSVTMTAISTIISTVMLPANLLLYVNAAFGIKSDKDDGGSVLHNIDWASLFVSLAIVIVAIGLGLCASFRISSHRFNRFANRMGSLSGVLLIVFSAIVSSLSGSNESQIWGLPWSFYVGVTSPCFVGLFIATGFGVLARLRKPEVISVGVECCYQNVGIATSAAVAMFDDPIKRGQALCVPLFYGLMEGVVLGIYCIIGWKLGWTKAPRNEKFCTMLVTTYEVDADDAETDRDFAREQGEERQIEQNSSSRSIDIETAASPENWSNPETTWRRRWSLFGRKRKRRERKRKDSDDKIEQAMSSPRRASSLPSPINDGLEVLSQIDSITDLVPFPPQKVEYSRCRVNSEEGTAITAAMSETTSNNGSPNSMANSCTAKISEA
mmetsp:Transcript_38127/g.80255  ORF Transcript_38127/g.80255 Transcript_38127/m.80255 type:complete len:516 (+) Transcript_38127:380-1927(+)